MSCDPCDDCDSILFEPTVSFVFINQDSIENINDSLAVISFNDSRLSVSIDSLIILRDSLQTIQELIDNGENLDREKMAIEMFIHQQKTDSLLFADLNQGTDTIIPILNQAKSIINSGLILVNQIKVLGTSFMTKNEDSATNWSIPLSFDQSFNRYEITINDLSEVIELEYHLFQEVDEQRTVLIRAACVRARVAN